MKRLSMYLFVLFCLSTISAGAQDYINFGPKAAFSANNFQEVLRENNITYSSFNTISLGLFARLNPGRLYLQPEVYYGVKGADFTSQAGDAGSGKIRLQTLDAPVLLGYHLIRSSGVNLRAFAGPVFNLYTKESQNDLRPWDPERYGIRDGVNSLQAGLGVDLLMFTVDARIERGLRRYDNDMGVRPGQYSISLGYKLF